jgi:hypothetical protein
MLMDEDGYPKEAYGMYGCMSCHPIISTYVMGRGRIVYSPDGVCYAMICTEVLVDPVMRVTRNPIRSRSNPRASCALVCVGWRRRFSGIGPSVPTPH